MTEDNGQHPWPRYASIDEAMEARHMPIENREFIRRMVAAIGISTLLDHDTYLSADRAGGGPALNIRYGYTNGFLSAEEATRATEGRAEIWPSGRGTGQWGVTHPENRMRMGATDRARAADRDFGTCPTCHMALPATGVCDDCG